MKHGEFFMKRALIIILLLAGCQAAQAQPQTSLDSLKVLIGKWTGEGQSEWVQAAAISALNEASRIKF